MAVKIYTRKGNISLKEKAMVRELEKAVTRLSAEDPNFKLTPANNLVELEELYNKYAITDVEYVEAVPENDGEEPEKIVDEFKKKTTTEKSSESAEKVIDPFNRDEPIVRDYVLQEEFEDVSAQSTKSSFDEPLSFDESFSIPDSETLGQKAPEPSGYVEPEPEPKSQEPLNPHFNDMDSAKQRKKTKRFVKQIINLTCDLLEKGFEWYVMKDITEAKLTEYEINDEMDLSLLLEVTEGQQITVKEFFLSQHAVIKEQAKIDDEDREDLIEDLTEVFLEKGIAPTPMQSFLLTASKVVGLKLITGYSIVASNNAVLNQLRKNKQEEVSYDDYQGEPEPTPPPPPRPPRQERTPEPQQEVVYDFTETMFPVEKVKE